MALNTTDVRAYAAKAEEYLARLIPLKTKAEYDPGNISRSKAHSAVKSATRIVETARRLLI